MTDTDSEHLKLAFVLDHIRRIVDADGAESYAEFRLVGQLLPRPMLRDAGFMDDDGALTAHFENSVEKAKATLPSSTELAQKEEIFSLLYAACAVDELVPEEVVVLREAGAALGMSADQVTMLLGTLVSTD